MVDEDRLPAGDRQSDGGGPLRIAYVTSYDARERRRLVGAGILHRPSVGAAGRARSNTSAPMSTADRLANTAPRRPHAAADPAATSGPASSRASWTAWPLPKTARMAGQPADVVLGLAADHLARLAVRRPQSSCGLTARSSAWSTFYDYASNLSGRTRRQILAAEGEALGSLCRCRCTRPSGPRRWRCASYGLAADRVHVIPVRRQLGVAAVAATPWKRRSLPGR